MSTFRTVGARLSLALLAVVALVLGLVYLIVVPSLRNRLIDAKLNDLARAAPKLVREYEHHRHDPDFLSNADASTNARVILLSVLTQSPPTVTVQDSSRPGQSGMSTGDAAARGGAVASVAQSLAVALDRLRSMSSRKRRYRARISCVLATT